MCFNLLVYFSFIFMFIYTNSILLLGSNAKINNQLKQSTAHMQKSKAWTDDVDQTGGVTLTELRVPTSVMAGVKSGVVLDCLYTLRPKSIGLVVAWYFNNSARPVYQWIPGQKPLSIGVFRHRANLDYRASDNNETMHRALHIINPTIELTGDYRCVVSTYHDEDFMIKRMIVYSPEKKFEVYQKRVNNDTLRVTCMASGVFPLPKLTLFNNSVTEKQSYALANSRYDVNRLKDGYYEVIISVLINEYDIEPQSSLDCELKIPDTPYVKRKTFVYFQDSNTASRTYSVVWCIAATYWIINFAVY
ncbi:uncharacterized protein LOC126899326 isoform X2 [Daktulosphaira vitifoliae]|uniref:uncharacterized protein LOC126899326 isoform X2 n=1 Tax=Daktulosphaira vitifoliae TaxID=58002 RepID=UPI0021AA57E9|nr:uncharacterized protein LOC126899326 isoform X2 [Daktulosphaira vitifoliae]